MQSWRRPPERCVSETCTGTYGVTRDVRFTCVPTDDGGDVGVLSLAHVMRYTGWLLMASFLEGASDASDPDEQPAGPPARP
ncbi:hypothetical protein AND_008989 [Anopheles darlingi]|uniref:Uncharacterized protein n=1 Tax=Anopheles darlingi TaxID=43151 RepID=W5J9J4_ANODA|nr:hypothetical protein AND_008989 [Anopheles darlingi]